jgi:hypothetical protein
LPRVRVDVDDVLRSALGMYTIEVRDILSAVREEALAAGVDPEPFYPGAVAREMKTIEIANRVLEAFSDQNEPFLQLMGEDVPDSVCSVLVSVLMLKQEDLVARVRMREADPLSPREAVLLLRAQIDAIDQRLQEAVWARPGPSPLLGTIRERRAIKQGQAFPRALDLLAVQKDGEGQELEFMVKCPDHPHDLAKEVAAFGSSNPGTIFLGVNDEGEIVGLDGVATIKDRDRLQTRVETICANSVSPPLITRTSFEEYDNNRVLRIEVPKGPEPVYFSNDRPYVRHGSLSRPARPQEVTELVRRWLTRQRG